MIYISPGLGQYLSANNISRYASYDGDSETLSPREIHAIYQEHPEEALEILSQIPDDLIRNIIFSRDPQGNYVFGSSERERIHEDFPWVGRPESNHPEIPEGGIYCRYVPSLDKVDFEEAVFYLNFLTENKIPIRETECPYMLAVQMAIVDSFRSLYQAWHTGLERDFSYELETLRQIHEKISWTPFDNLFRKFLFSLSLGFHQKFDLVHSRRVFQLLAELDPSSYESQIAFGYLNPSPIVRVFSHDGDEFRFQRLSNYYPENSPPAGEPRDPILLQTLKNHAVKVLAEEDLAELTNYVLSFIGFHPEFLEINPQQAAVLSAKIVMEAMDYDHALADGDISRALSGRGTTEEEYDQASVLALLQTGSGVCRHYAKAVNVIFEILKALYPNLEHSYMMPVIANNKLYYVDTLAKWLVYPHEYNLLLTQTSFGWEVTALDATRADNLFTRFDDLLSAPEVFVDPTTGNWNNFIVNFGNTLYDTGRINARTFDQLVRFALERAPSKSHVQMILLGIDSYNDYLVLKYHTELADRFPNSLYTERAKALILNIEGRLPENAYEFSIDHGLGRERESFRLNAMPGRFSLNLDL